VLVIGDMPASPQLLGKMERSVFGNRQLRMSGWFPFDEAGRFMGESPADAHDGNHGVKSVNGAESGFGQAFIAADGVLLLADVPDALRRVFTRGCAKSGKTLFCVPSPEDVLLAGAGVLQFGDVPVMVVEQSCRRQEVQWLKRVLDVAFSFTALLACTPLFLLATMLVRFSGSGPVFFIQERVTRHGKIFPLVKFRTMMHHAEGKTGPVLSPRHDPRITPIGRFLRRARLDELPQLWNILCGDMSLVGPRPERPVFVEQFEREMPGYHLRHAVRSGLTGLAQVYGNYATSAGDKLVFDLIYIRDWSLLMDLQIVLRTITAVFRREAAEGVESPEGEARI
jgi:exopolysaccharide biosynthesis polyprenyl glycosylphosphotransferase